MYMYLNTSNTSRNGNISAKTSVMAMTKATLRICSLCLMSCCTLVYFFTKIIIEITAPAAKGIIDNRLKSIIP
jgi:hypothetical protein